MTRRNRYSHRLIRVRGTSLCEFDGNDLAVVFSFNGRVTITSKREVATLDHGDAAVLMQSDSADFRISPSARDCYLALLRERSVHPG